MTFNGGDGQVRRWQCPGGLRNAVEPVNWKPEASAGGGVGDGKWSEKGLGMGAIGAGDLPGSHSFLGGTQSILQWELRWFGLVPFRV